MSEYPENRLEGDEGLRSSKKVGRTRFPGMVLLVAAAVVPGREVWRRYRRSLDPRVWFDEKPR